MWEAFILDQGLKLLYVIGKDRRDSGEIGFRVRRKYLCLGGLE